MVVVRRWRIGEGIIGGGREPPLQVIEIDAGRGVPSLRVPIEASAARLGVVLLGERHIQIDARRVVHGDRSRARGRSAPVGSLTIRSQDRMEVNGHRVSPDLVPKEQLADTSLSPSASDRRSGSALPPGADNAGRSAGRDCRRKGRLSPPHGDQSHQKRKVTLRA
jgi:hypothetical protein